MNDISNEKIMALQHIILEHAHRQREALASDARKEAETWLSKEMAKLEHETNAVLADAKLRAEDIYRRQILSAEKEKTTETLKHQNRLLDEALKKFRDGLVHLRDRPDYIDILTGLALEAARSLTGETGALRLRLATLDSSLGENVAKAVNGKNLGLSMTFDHEPAPIIGDAGSQARMAGVK